MPKTKEFSFAFFNGKSYDIEKNNFFSKGKIEKMVFVETIHTKRYKDKLLFENLETGKLLKRENL